VKLGHRGDAGVQVKRMRSKWNAWTPLKNVRPREWHTSAAGDDVKKRPSCRTRCDAIKIDCHLFTIEIPNVVADSSPPRTDVRANIYARKPTFKGRPSRSRVWKIERPEIIYLRKWERCGVSEEYLLWNKSCRALREKITAFVRPNISDGRDKICFTIISSIRLFYTERVVTFRK